MDTIFAALITGLLAFAGVITTNIMSNRRVEAQLEKAQAVTETKLENLTAEVRKHNSFGDRITMLEAKVNELSDRIERMDARIARYHDER